MMNFIKKHKNLFIYIGVVLFSIAFIAIGFLICRPAPKEGQSAEMDAYVAKVLSIDNVETSGFTLDGAGEIESKKIEFSAKITSGGTLNSVRITAFQSLDGLLAVSPKQVEPGDKVILNYLDAGDGSGLTWNFMEYYRSGGLVFLGVLFFGLLLLFGRKKGVNTIISLIFTCLAIFMVFVPSIISGYNIYLMAIIVCAFIVFMTLIVVNGLNIKTVCAIAGNLGGLAVTGVLTLIMDKVLHLTGVVDESSLYLMLMNGTKPIDLRAIIFGAIMIGALGATMDVAMTIASALNELAENMDKKTYKTMLKSGFNIGRDAMSTMTNTLILAYIGSSLSVVLLIVGNGQSLLTIFNLEMIVVEVLQALVGSIGILFTIPITSILAAYLYNHHKYGKTSGSAVEGTNPPD